MSRKFIILLFSASLLIRMIFLGIFGHVTKLAEERDSASYTTIARNLVAGDGFIDMGGEPTQARAPVYPLFLAGLYKVFGNNEVAVKICQGTVDSLRVVTVAYIAYAIFGWKAALLAGIFNAIYPPYVLYSNIMLTEFLFTFFLAVFCFFLSMCTKTLKMENFIYLGIAQGLATLTRGTSLFIPFFVLLLFILLGDFKRFVKGFIVFIAVSSAIIAVWTIRNYSVFKSFVPVSTGGGWLIWFSMQKDAWDGDRLVELHPLDRDEFKDLRGLPWYEWEKIVARRALMGAIQKPFNYAGILWHNFIKLWSLPVGKVVLAEKHPVAAGVYKAGFVIVVLISFFGMLKSLFELGFLCVSPLILMLAYVSLLHIAVLPVPRYRLPFEQFMLVFFSFGILKLWPLLKYRK